MDFTRVKNYETATIRGNTSGTNRSNGLTFSRSIPGTKGLRFVAVNGNMTTMAEIAEAITFLTSITEDVLTTPEATAPAGLMAPPSKAAPAIETVPCHSDWQVGDIIETDDGNYRVVSKGKAARI